MRSLVHTEIVLSQRMAQDSRALVPLHRFLCVCTYAAAEIITVACAHGTARARQKAIRVQRNKTKTDQSFKKCEAQRARDKGGGGMWQGAEGDEHSHEVAEASASAYRDCTERPHGPDRLRAGTTPPLSSNPDQRLRPSHTAHLCYGPKAETTTQQRMARTTHRAVNRKAPNDGKKETDKDGRADRGRDAARGCVPRLH